MEPRKHAICEALSRWINQRPGFDPGNYDRAGYRADSRRVQQQRRDALRLLMEVTRHDTLTADDLLKASRGAFSGRLTILTEPTLNNRTRIDYCTGQYFCTEYRAAACAVLASALWGWTREHAMPPPYDWDDTEHGRTNERYSWAPGQRETFLSAGDWLRAHFAHEFGRGIAQRWFR